MEPLVAGSLALEHYTRIVQKGRRFAVTDSEGEPEELHYADEDVILHLAERIKKGIPEKFLTDDAIERGQAE